MIDPVELMGAAGTPLVPGSMPVERNAIGKVPVPETDDGTGIFGIRVIWRYLDDLTGFALYPAKPGSWAVLTLEATADGILDAAWLMTYEARVRPEDKRLPDWVEAQRAKTARALDMIEGS